MGKKEWFVPTLRERLMVPEAEGGGGGSSMSLPTADPVGATIDSTTYDNPVTGGPDKLNVLLGAADPPDGDQILLAMGEAGADFPNTLFLAAGGIYLNDGTSDPYNGAAFFIGAYPNGDDTFKLQLGGTNLNQADSTYGHVDQTGNPLRFGGTNFTQTSCNGDPNGQVPGNLGDACFRADSDGTGQSWLYRCSSAGDASTAVWTGMI